VTKYCTIIDGCFRIHKSRLSDQTDHIYDLTNCSLTFPEERTRDIQFALIDKTNNEKIFIRGNHIYTMGRLLNTLSKYVEIRGSSQSVFQDDERDRPCPLPRRLSQQEVDFQPYDRIDSTRVYDIPITIERTRRFYELDDEPTVYDNLSKSDGIGQFRFVVPFHHSSKSAFTKIKPHRSPTLSSSSNSTLPQTSSSSNYSTANSNNNNNNPPPPPPPFRSRLMTAV